MTFIKDLNTNGSAESRHEFLESGLITLTPKAPVHQQKTNCYVYLKKKERKKKRRRKGRQLHHV